MKKKAAVTKIRHYVELVVIISIMTGGTGIPDNDWDTGMIPCVSTRLVPGRSTPENENVVKTGN